MSIILIIYQIPSSACALHNAIFDSTQHTETVNLLPVVSQACLSASSTCSSASVHLSNRRLSLNRDPWANLFFSWGSVCIWGTAVPVHLFEIWCSQLPHLLLQFSPWFLRRHGLVDLWLCDRLRLRYYNQRDCNLHHTHRILMKYLWKFQQKYCPIMYHHHSIRFTTACQLSAVQEETQTTSSII